MGSCTIMILVLTSAPTRGPQASRETQGATTTTSAWQTTSCSSSGQTRSVGANKLWTPARCAGGQAQPSWWDCCISEQEALATIPPGATQILAQWGMSCPNQAPVPASLDQGINLLSNARERSLLLMR